MILSGVKLGGILGNQQSAIFVQCCFRTGEAKNMYGTGMFLMMNMGDIPVRSDFDLIAMVAYSLGENGGDDRKDNGTGNGNKSNVMCAPEGSVSH